MNGFKIQGDGLSSSRVYREKHIFAKVKRGNMKFFFLFGACRYQFPRSKRRPIPQGQGPLTADLDELPPFQKS